MEEIWIVCVDYAVTHVKGYFTTEEKACEYCEIMSRIDNQYDYYYEKLEELDIEEVRELDNKQTYYWD